MIDPLGRITLYSYDNQGRQIAVTEAAGTLEERTTAMVYDERGRLVNRIDANKHVTTFTYDALGRVLSTENAELGALTLGGSEVVFQFVEGLETRNFTGLRQALAGSTIAWCTALKARQLQQSPLKAAPTRAPVHIDIGGEGRYPGAINVNPGMGGGTPVTSGPTQAGGAGAAGRPIPNLVQATGERLPFANQSVDIVTLQNAPIRPATVTEIARVIRPGGDIRLVGPNTPEVLAAHRQVANTVGGRAYQTVVGDSVYTNIIVPAR